MNIFANHRYRSNQAGWQKRRIRLVRFHIRKGDLCRARLLIADHAIHPGVHDLNRDLIRPRFESGRRIDAIRRVPNLSELLYR